MTNIHCLWFDTTEKFIYMNSEMRNSQNKIVGNTLLSSLSNLEFWNDSFQVVMLVLHIGLALFFCNESELLQHLYIEVRIELNRQLHLY